MYLSRVELDTTKRQTQIAMVSRNKFHGAVEMSFEREEGSRLRNLWRLDKLAGKTYLLLLSSKKPDLSGIVKQFGNPGSICETKSYDVLLDRITEQSVWRFRIVANPTKCEIRADGRGKRVAYRTCREQEQWFLKQAEKNGFHIVGDNLEIVETTGLSFNKRYERIVRALAVTYEGILQVNDVEKFRKVLVEGLGREKAYGLGLLTIMRADL